MANDIEPDPSSAGDDGLRSFPAQQQAGVLLSIDEMARRQVRIKQLNLQKAILATVLQEKRR
jgi:hypothetical protein